MAGSDQERGRCRAEVRLNNLKAAQADFEKALATGDATPEETSQWTETLFSIAASTGQYQRAIDFGKTMFDNGTVTNDTLAIIAQSYYLLKDCNDSGVWADKAIAAARNGGEAPKENLYLFKLHCASDAGDKAAMDGILMDLIRLTNKTTYWNTLLRIERQDARDDHNTLMIYRIMYNTNSMNADTDYIETALNRGAIKDEHKDRADRLLTALRVRADADKSGLPKEEAEAFTGSGVDLLAKLGEQYYGFGDYQKAAATLDQALQRGQVSHVDETLAYLGLAEMHLKRIAEAKKTFSSISAASNASARVSSLWRARRTDHGTRWPLECGSLPLAFAHSRVRPAHRLG